MCVALLGNADGDRSSRGNLQITPSLTHRGECRSEAGEIHSTSELPCVCLWRCRRHELIDERTHPQGEQRPVALRNLVGR